MNFVSSVEGDVDALAQARREGVKDVVKHLLSFKPTAPWGEAVAKHFGIDLREIDAPFVEVQEEKTHYPSYEEQRDAYLEETGLTLEQYQLIVSDPEKPVHCDGRVIHAPGECEYCDKYGVMQQIQRMALMVCFTNQTPEQLTTKGWKPCPAMYVRGADSINSWGGNVAKRRGQ
jgi:hypothetical protein